MVDCDPCATCPLANSGGAPSPTLSRTRWTHLLQRYPVEYLLQRYITALVRACEEGRALPLVNELPRYRRVLGNAPGPDNTPTPSTRPHTVSVTACTPPSAPLPTPPPPPTILLSIRASGLLHLRKIFPSTTSPPPRRHLRTIFAIDRPGLKPTMGPPGGPLFAVSAPSEVADRACGASS